MIQLSSLSKRFGDRVLLDTVSWQIDDRERVGLAGPNGAGKTTLLKILAGLDEADSGTVIKPSGLTVGYLPQDGLNHSGRTLVEEAGLAFKPVLDMRDEIQSLEERLADDSVPESEHAAMLYEELHRLGRRREQLAFLDEHDLRYRNRVQRPEPVARAAMFCLMDVSASMDEEKKDLAKRFFTLLYLFLTRKYNEVELVFIRHTDDAQEVDEDTFFHDTRSGGTIVLSALELAEQIRAERYASGWNVYAAQASDGDAFGADPAKSARYLRERLLPVARYYTYLELAGGEAQMRSSSLWVEYERIQADAKNFAMRRAWGRDQIYPVFRELFRKEGQ